MTRTRNSLLNISTGLVGQVLTLLTGFIVRSVFINKLGATYLGLSGLFSNILSILSFAELGFGQAIIFSLYRPIAEGDTKKIGCLMSLFRRVYLWMFVIVAVLGTSLTPFLDFFTNRPVEIPHFSIIYLMYVGASASSYLFSYKKSLLFASQKTYISTTISYYFTIISAILQVVILVFTLNFILYLTIQIVSNVILDIVISRKTDRLYPFLKQSRYLKLPIEDLARIKKDVKALIIYKIGTLSLNSTDNIIISKYVGLLTVGLYSNYYLLCTSVGGFLSTVFSNITASIGNMNAVESPDMKIEMFFKIDMATFWFYGISTLCLYTCMTPFILIWVGPEYALSNATSFIIAFNQYIAGMLYSSFNYRQTMGLFRQGQFRPIISAILNIVLSIILAISFGLSGVLWGTALTRLLTNVWYDPYIVFKKGLQCSPWRYFKSYTSKLFVYLVAALTCGYIASKVQGSSFLNLIVIFLITIVMSFTIFYVFYGRASQTRYLWTIAKNSINIIFQKS